MPPQTLDAAPPAPVALPLEPIVNEPTLQYRPPPAAYTEQAQIEPTVEVTAETIAEAPPEPALEMPATEIAESNQPVDEVASQSENAVPPEYDDGIAPHATDYHQSQAPTLRLMQRSLSPTSGIEAPEAAITVPDAVQESVPTSAAESIAPAVTSETVPPESPQEIVLPAATTITEERPDIVSEAAVASAADPATATAPAGTPMPTASANGLAITGLVLAFIFAPLGMVISIMALVKRKTKAAKLISTAGILVSAVGIAAMLYFSMALAESFTTVRGHNLDMKHQANMEAVENQLQAAFIKNGSYPTLSQLNSSSWRAENLTGTTAEQLSPSIPPTALLSDQPTHSAYAYATMPEHCDTSKAQPCTSFSLSAVLSTGKTYTIH